MGKKSIVEKLEHLRNLRFAIRGRVSTTKNVKVSDIVHICGEAFVDNRIDINKRVSFVGFFNEFDDVYGKDCVYIHLFGKQDEDREWLAHRAVRHGALAVISDYQIGDLPCIVVDDVWRVLRDISRLYLEDYQGGTVAISGSIGKTTTKEMVECVLARNFKTFCTPNNGNVLAYLSFEIQHMPFHVEQFIQEVDESYPNNASDCSYVLQPDVAIITTIDNSHVGALGGEYAVEKAITAVTDYVPEHGVIIISADDPKSVQAQFQRRVISVGIHNKSAECVATDVRSDGKSVDFTVQYAGEKTHVHLNCPGEHNVYNAMFAFVTGKLSGMDSTKIVKGLEDYRPMTIRQKTYHAMGKTLYVDCFNASARSIGSALEVLEKMRPRFGGRRIAVLGDVADIDGFEEETYLQIADRLNASHVDFLV